MHKGNLSFQPRLTPAPAWRQAARAAVGYWQQCAAGSRISPAFQAICQTNATAVARALEGQ